MLQQNIVVKVLAVFLTTIFLFAGATVILSNNAMAWEARVYFSPTTVTAGDIVNFEIKITNTGSDSMKITWIGVHFDWMDEGYYYTSKDVSEDYPYILGSGSSATFYIGVPIPNGISTNTHHSFTIRIYASDPGLLSEWGDPYYIDYSSSVFVEEPTYKVYGYVYDADTGDAVGGATVTIGSYTITTNYYGYYSIDGIKEGTYTITVEAYGYQSSSKTITVNEDTEVDFNLPPTSTGGGGGESQNGELSNPGSEDSGDGWLYLIGALLIILIVIIILVAVVTSKRKNIATPQRIMPPPETQQKTEMNDSKFCPYCGREIPSDSKICPYCGNKLE